MQHLKKKKEKETSDQIDRQSKAITADVREKSRQNVPNLWSVSIETHFYG